MIVSTEEIKKLVLVRLEAMPPNISVSVGSKDLSRDKLIKEVKNGTELGKLITKMQLKYLHAMKSGFK